MKSPRTWNLHIGRMIIHRKKSKPVWNKSIILPTGIFRYSTGEGLNVPQRSKIGIIFLMSKNFEFFFGFSQFNLVIVFTCCISRKSYLYSFMKRRPVKVYSLSSWTFMKFDGFVSVMSGIVFAKEGFFPKKTYHRGKDLKNVVFHMSCALCSSMRSWVSWLLRSSQPLMRPTHKHMILNRFLSAKLRAFSLIFFDSWRLAKMRG